MRFLADENMPPDVIATLRAAGHEVVSVRETRRGASDADVAAEAGQNGLILLTCDKDFGELVYARTTALEGVVLFRLRDMPYATRSRRMAEAIESGFSLQWFFTVVEPDRIRQRPMPRRH